MDISRAELKYQVERQREEIRTLNKVGRLLGSTTDPQKMIHLVASYLHETFPVALCGTLLVAQKKLYVNLYAHLTQMERSSAIRKIREATSELLRRPITEQESEPVVEEVPNPAQAMVQTAIALRSHVFAPLTGRKQPTGFFCLFSGQADAFTEEDQHAIGVVAEQLGAALRNALLVEELRIADELKNQMLSIVSHELSTPLTAIKEGVNLVLEGALGDTTEEQRDFLGTVAENTDRLERMLDKVKTSTKVMTGQLAMDFKSVDLRTIIERVEQAYRSLAKDRHVNFMLVKFPKPLFWQVDVSYLTLAISQVVENAIQATPEDGMVTVRLSTAAEETEIQVLDTGPGIPQAALPTLFDRFKSLGEIHERKMGGLGLGLFIAKSIIDQHGGTITPESNPGETTLMIIRLPKQTPRPTDT